MKIQEPVISHTRNGRPLTWTRLATTLIRAFSFSLCVSWALQSSAVEPAAAAAPLSESFPEGLISFSSRPEFSKNIFVVDKARRVLRVYQYENQLPRMVLEVPSDLGKRPGPKLRENDYRTPVGIYFLQKKLSQPEIPFNLYGDVAFTTDYPNVFDKRDAKTGSGIWLHAVPDNVALTRGSRGCVVVRNDMVKKLADYVTLGQTPMLIYDKISELSLEDYKKQRTQYLNFIETWRTAWQNEDIESYIKFYDPTFFNANMDYKQWYNHKKRLKGFYKFIEVSFSEPTILKNKDQVVIRMLQHYRSDRHDDFGEKTIHAHYSPEQGFHIVREDWKPAPRPADWSIDSSARSLSTIDPVKSAR